MARAAVSGVRKPTAACRPSVTRRTCGVFIDPDLLLWPEVWSAVGTWHDVFGIEPHELVEASEGLVTDLKRS
jgi:prolyl-tRNA editing enzyme YbaK/EbsC (Cys-tRNA(Pro) deacylase)